MGRVIIPPGDIRTYPQSEMAEVVETSASGVEEGEEGLEWRHPVVEHLLGEGDGVLPLYEVQVVEAEQSVNEAVEDKEGGFGGVFFVPGIIDMDKFLLQPSVINATILLL